MKKLIGLGLLLVACRSSGPATPTPAATLGGPGAASAGAALTAMMAAVKAEDIQAFAAVWGDQKGSVRDQWPRSELEMRAYITMKCLRHDKFTVLSDGNGIGGRRVLNVQINYKDLAKVTNFTVVPGPQSRWYVEIFDMAPLDEICRKG